MLPAKSFVLKQPDFSLSLPQNKTSSWDKTEYQLHWQESSTTHTPGNSGKSYNWFIHFEILD